MVLTNCFSENFVFFFFFWPSSSVSLELRASVLCNQCGRDVETQHHASLAVSQQNYFFTALMELKGRRRTLPLWQTHLPWKLVITAPLAKLDLLLVGGGGTSGEVGWGLDWPALMLTSQLRFSECQIRKHYGHLRDMFQLSLEAHPCYQQFLFLNFIY